MKTHPESKHVLVVDDDQILRRIGVTFLSRFGLQVSTAESGRRAISAIEAGPLPDLVVTDINMADGTGIELLEFIRSHTEYRDIPVIVLSGTTKKEEIERIHELGCTAFFSKPARYGLILDQVARLLGVRVRAATRFDMAVSGWLRSGGDSWALETSNISSSGLFFETSCELERGQEYAIELPLPADYQDDSMVVRFRVVRIGSDPDPDSGKVGYGVEFVFETDDERQGLIALLQDLAT